MLLLDESLAAVTGNEVDDFFVLEEVFCQLFSACEHAHDVHRADQWIRIGDVIAQKRNLPAVSAFCRTHYGGVLTAAGRWPEADATLTEAVRLWGLGQRSMLRRGALARLADLRVRQGRFEEAAELLSGLDADSDPELARPLAALRLARGETALARDTLERALAHVDATSSGAASLLALLVDVHLASGDATNAAAAAEQLATCAAAHHGHYLGAVAALARGRVCLATGTGEPQTCLREALAGFARAEMPMELARARLELAHALVGDHPEVAIAEARSALEAFERLEAARDVDAAAAVLRTLGVSARTTTHSGEVLTKREAVCSSCSAMASRTRRSPSASTSAARPPSTTSATCWQSSGCAAAPRPPRSWPATVPGRSAVDQTAQNRGGNGGPPRSPERAEPPLSFP